MTTLAKVGINERIKILIIERLLLTVKMAFSLVKTNYKHMKPIISILTMKIAFSLIKTNYKHMKPINQNKLNKHPKFILTEILNTIQNNATLIVSSYAFFIQGKRGRIFGSQACNLPMPYKISLIFQIYENVHICHELNHFDMSFCHLNKWPLASYIKACALQFARTVTAQVFRSIREVYTYVNDRSIVIRVNFHIIMCNNSLFIILLP